MTQPTGVSRRSFLKSVALGAGAATVPAALTGCFGDDDDDDRDLTVFVFGHGVASGDPLADAVIIWTRVTPDNADGTEAEVAWVVARDEAMTDVVASGKEYTDAERDFTVKVDVTGLQPGTTYYYQFAGKDNAASPVGRTQTLPAGSVDSVTLAVCSCANYPAGFFNAYRAMAESDVDVVLHLGDYIYEYGSNEYPSPDAQGRQPEPVSEILTLEQYRARYAQYRSDVDLQAVHASKPFICVWDDHELANDAYKNGAQNHNDGEGDFFARRSVAQQAYHEWLPIRTGADRGKIYRSFDFGNLLSLHMADTRMLARDKPLSYGDFIDGQGNIDINGFSAALADTSRTLLGAEQQQHIVGNMIDSSATWQVLGQQVLMGRIMIPIELLSGLGEIQAMLEAGVDASAKQAEVAQLLAELATIKATDPSNPRVTAVAPYNLDAWDGYFPAREEILRRAQLLDKNLVVLAGDTHNAWASELYVADDSGNVQRDQGAVGVEFATSSVTSPGFETYVGFGDNAQLQAGFEQAVTTLVDDLKFLNAKSRGFMRVEFTHQQAKCDWVFIDTIASKDYTATTAKSLKVKPGKGQRRLQEA
ncbi:alkaline phosphatase [Bacterioplanes sanyensis]|uniref:alkaline phosphatase D family protein n=1 Tax=Bacterioplanes sanyensis TaxID=1249553 RepID=UPI001674A07B|nr:alkaline phosphatase D family protein [Bacterioplanes sanyensis]GGY44321.1 alkaline phosphatase [Bacterioplanes sanyensis]